MFWIAAYEMSYDGRVIYEVGDHGDWIYIYAEGEVEILIKCGRAASGH